jgi:hypothetical protein
VIGQSKRLIAEKHSALGKHLTTNYCESQYITLNGKFKVNKNAQVPSAPLFGIEKKEPYLERHFRNFFNAVYIRGNVVFEPDIGAQFQL